MSNNTKKLLLLDSANQIPTGESVNRWTKAAAADVTNFIKHIITSEGSAGEQKEKFRAMISGIPSPWARVMLTRKSVCQNSAELGSTVLDECYKLFKSEWRGLVAAYVLRPDSFEFSKPVALVGRDVQATGGEMSILNIYGEMLFDEAPLWTLRNVPFCLKENPPCIQILYYKVNDGSGFKLKPVGATSPYTLLFSSVNYNLLDAKKDIPWVGTDGKLCDPTFLEEEKFKVEEAQRLHSFIHNIAAAIRSSENEEMNPNKYYLDYINALLAQVDRNVHSISFPEVRAFIDSWLTELGRWEAELEARIVRAGKRTNTSIPIAVAMPEGPLAILMNNEHTFYLDGKYLYSRADGLQSPTEISSGDIFLSSEYIAAWKGVNNDKNRDHSKSPVFYLRTTNGEYYLALPFTQRALEVFGNAISEIMSPTGTIRLEANVGNDGKVEIDFKAKLDGGSDEMSICKKTYQMEVIPESDGKVFVWPNFSSPQWNKYFYYSEFPTNVTGVRMLPNFEGADFASAAETTLEDMYLVKYPVNKVSTTLHKYEIISSSTPLKSVSVRLTKSGEDVCAGTLILKTEANGGYVGESQFMKYKANLNLQPATVGIDFGSTNTCAYYKLNGGNESVPVPFSNRRLAIVGFDNPALSLAQKDELFFISNEGTISANGQVKSWLHEHDPQYLTSDGRAESVNNMDREIVGGVPVNESNISVVAMDEHIITTNAGKLHYNMKWLSESESEKRKTAFVRMLWIHLCADMVDNNAYPQTLHWSFPSAMSVADRMVLKKIYRTAVELPFEASIVRPTCHSFTEAESVCAYSIYRGTEVNASRLALGIDVGGSTSDILIMGSKANINTLLTQSSVRLAGGFFFKAINESQSFRRALYNFHNSKRTKVSVLNIEDVMSKDPAIYRRSPYYLNNIFDQLCDSADFVKFYGYLHTEVPVVFALPAYVTGILLFYSGMLVKNVLTKNNMDSVKEVHMRYYGKGGRLFEWLLDQYEEVAENYYKRCFNAGLGSDDVKFILDNFVNDAERQASKIENKSEVAMGLVSGNHLSIAEGEVDPDGERIIENYDIIGEKGFIFAKPGADSRELNDMDVISNDIFDGGINLSFPDTMENFNRFLDIFIRFIEVNSGGIMKDLTDLNNGRNNLKVMAYIQNDPEYRKFQAALKSGQKASYRMPIIIAAALSYLNNTLLPAVAKQLN